MGANVLAPAAPETIVAPVHPVAPSRLESIQRAEKIPPLTSLRFFAAALVVLSHSAVFFATFLPEQASRWNANLGVTFFFVLSGFVLAYAYPSPRVSGVRKFWLARVARIWPAHVVAFIMLLLVVPRNEWTGPGTNHPDSAIAYLFLVQSWLPWPRWDLSFTVAWSVSVELMFYLLFPLLIVGMKWKWIAPVGIALIALVAMSVASVNSHVPRLTGVALSIRTPWPCLFEFVVGIGACLVWQRVHPYLRMRRGVATALEIVAVALVLWTVCSTPWPFSGLTEMPWWLEGARTAAVYVLASLVFAALIFVMALQAGAVSRLLSLAPFVLLGEISYSIYLIHFTILVVYRAHLSVARGLPEGVIYLVYWLVVLVASFSLWVLVEIPMRRFLVGLWPRRAPATGRAARRASLLDPPRVAGVVAALVLLIPFTYAAYRTPTPSLAHRTVAATGIQADFRADVGSGERAGPLMVRRGTMPAEGVIVSGWALDAAHHHLVRVVYLSIDGTTNIRATYGLIRPYVARYFNDDTYLHAGFTGYIPLAALPTGTHQVTLKVIGDDATTFFESPPMTIVIA
ncbi:MAG: acyltransferase family protein [Thermomicrobiales bacterium]